MKYSYSPRVPVMWLWIAGVSFQMSSGPGRRVAWLRYCGTSRVEHWPSCGGPSSQLSSCMVSVTQTRCSYFSVSCQLLDSATLKEAPLGITLSISLPHFGSQCPMDIREEQYGRGGWGRINHFLLFSRSIRMVDKYSSRKMLKINWYNKLINLIFYFFNKDSSMCSELQGVSSHSVFMCPTEGTFIWLLLFIKYYCSLYIYFFG